RRLGLSSLICSVIERHVGRLEELLAEHEEIEADEADERYDRAALDCSPAFERHRRYQSARHRELLRTLEAFRKMRMADFGMGNGEAEKADGKCRMADDGCEVRSGGCGDGECGETTPQVSQSRIDRGRENRLIGPPSLRTVLAVFPHTAAQLVVLPRRGLTGQRVGGFQAIQPLRCKEFGFIRNERTFP